MTLFQPPAVSSLEKAVAELTKKLAALETTCKSTTTCTTTTTAKPSAPEPMEQDEDDDDVDLFGSDDEACCYFATVCIL